MKLILREVLRSISIYGLAIMFSMLVPILTLPIILNGLSIEEYGLLGSLLSVIVVLIPLSSLNVVSALLRYTKKDSPFNYADSYNQVIVGNAFILFAIGFVISLSLCFFLFKREWLVYMLLLFSSRSIYSYLLSIVRVRNAAKVYAGIDVFRNIFYIGGIGVLSYLAQLQLKSLFMLMTTGYLIGILPILAYLYKMNWLGLRFYRPMMMKIIAYSLPVLPVYLIQPFLQQSALLMLEGSEEFIGRLNYANKIGVLVFSIQAILFLAWPYFAFKYQKEILHQYVFNFLIIIFLSMLWGFYFSFDFVTMLIANEEYLNTRLLCIGFMGAYIIATLGNFIDTTAGIEFKTHQIALFYILGAFVVLLLYRLLPVLFLKIYSFVPVLVGFLLMLFIKIIVYTRLKYFKSWNNYSMAFLVFNLLVIFYLEIV